MRKPPDKKRGKGTPLLGPTDVVRISRVFSHSECEEIISLAVGLPAGGDQFIDYGEVRGASKVSWLDMEKSPDWLRERIADLMQEAAKGFDFDISGGVEGLKLIRYRRGNRVPWHADCGAGKAVTRKLTMTVLLSSPDAFDGGALTLAGYTRETHRAIGDVVIFPSYMAHKVTTVTRGNRHTMVVWAHGTQFR